MKEIVYYNSPLGVLKLQSIDEWIAEVAFLKTTKNGASDENISFETPGTEVLKKCIRQLDDYFAGINLHFNLPLQQQGTDFQQKVWKGLLNIKPGRTISYLQFSKDLGDAKAIRAVGTANGRNNIAIIVPCHRVIGSNGTLVGYAGDLWRKQWLLNHEGKYCNGVQMLW